MIPAIPPQQKHMLFNKLTVKIDANVTDHTLEYVNNLWKSLTNQFALPRLAMILHKVAEGCIGVTWLFPANLVKHITTMVQETANKFAEEHILSVMLEEKCIYPMETEPSVLDTKSPLLETECPLLETEPSLVNSMSPLLETEPPLLETEPPLLETEPHLLETEPSLYWRLNPLYWRLSPTCWRLRQQHSRGRCVA